MPGRRSLGQPTWRLPGLTLGAPVRRTCAEAAARSRRRFHFGSPPFGVSVPNVRLPDQRGLTPISARAPRGCLDHTRSYSVCRHLVVTMLGLVSVGATLPVLPRLRPRPAWRGRFGRWCGHRIVRDHRARLPPDRRPLRRPAGRRVVVIAGAVSTAIAAPPVLRPAGIGGLIVARLFLGAGEGLVYTAGSAWVVDLAPPERRGRLRGLYGLAIWAGFSRAGHRRAHPARHQLRGCVGVRGRRAAGRRPDRPADPPSGTSPTPPARTSTAG